ncbi:MAG: diguanylate cyclase [Rhodoferax sp.]|nr:diguanylate cyclase [Rhodoferax sp.]
MPDRQSQTPPQPAHSTRRLRWLIVLGLVGANVLLLSSSSYLLWRSQQQHEKRAETLTQNVTKAVELNVVKTVAAVDLALQAVVDGLEAQLARGGIQPDAAQKLLATYEARVPAIEAIRVSRFDGLVIYGQGLDPAKHTSWADRDEFKLLQSQPQSGLQITEARMGKVAKRAIVSLTRRYNYPDGRFAGTVSAPVTVAHFTELLASFDVGTHGTLLLRDAQGRLITRFPALPDKPAGQMGNQLMSADFRRVFDKGLPVDTGYTAASPDGYRRIFTFQRIESAAMVAIVATAEVDYLADWRTEAWRTAFILLSFSLLSVVIGVAALRMLRRSELDAQRVLESKRFAAAVLDSLTDHVVVIDAHGTITKVNQAWLKFATDNGATHLESIQPGANYFEVCVGAATSTEGDDAAKAVQGIQAVMNGQLPEFTLEYPCHSPHLQRWFVMRAVNLAGSHKGAVLLHQDVTQRHRAEDLLKASEERFHLMFDTALDAMMLTAPDGRIFAANRTACTLLQRTEQELQAIGRNGVVDTTAPTLEPALQTRLHDGRIACELTFVRKDGTRFLCDVSSTLYTNSADQRVSSVVFRDITERKRIEAALRESEARMAAVFKASPLGIAISRLDDGTVLDINDACARLFGFEREELIGRKAVADLAIYRQPAQRDELVRLLREHATFQGVEVHYKTHAGQDLVVEVSARLIEVNHQPCVLAVMLDVTEKKREEDLIHAFAFHDALTQLPNRRLLTDRIKQALFNTKRHERVGALMYLDLDNFKPLNDTHGHEVGDLLLLEVAQRLTRCVREIDTVARVGGDEFVVLLSDLAPSRAEAHELARAVAEKILAAVAAPYQLIVGESADVATVTHHCSVSVGVALFAGDASSHTDILNWADAAMYQAKHAGRNTLRFHG